jgi:hypothetical protein
MRKATKGIFFRVTIEEYHKLKLIADSYDMTLSDVIKFWAFGPKEGPKPKLALKTHFENAA